MLIEQYVLKLKLSVWTQNHSKKYIYRYFWPKKIKEKMKKKISNKRTYIQVNKHI